MRKRNLIFPLVVSSLFMPSIEALESTTEFNSLENENNIYEAVDILIAEGASGGDGGENSSDKEATQKKRQPAKDAAKKELSINEISEILKSNPEHTRRVCTELFCQNKFDRKKKF